VERGRRVDEGAVMHEWEDECRCTELGVGSVSGRADGRAEMRE
jgi:hypothetical protein